MASLKEDIIKLITINEKLDRWNKGIYTESERQEIDRKVNDLFPPEYREELNKELELKIQKLATEFFAEFKYGTDLYNKNNYHD